MNRSSFFILIIILSFGCKEKIRPIIEPDLTKFDLNGDVKSIIQYNDYDSQLIALNPYRSSIEYKFFDSEGFLVKEYFVDDQDSIITKHYHAKNYLLDSSIIEYFNISDQEHMSVAIQGIGVDDNMEIDHYNKIAREHIYHYYYDTIPRLKEKIGLNYERDTIRIEKHNYNKEKRTNTQVIYFTKRDYYNEIIDSYNDKEQLVSRKFRHSYYYEYEYGETGLLTRFIIYPYQPYNEPFQIIDSIRYEFDSHRNWKLRENFSDGQIKSRINRKMKYN